MAPDLGVLRKMASSKEQIAGFPSSTRSTKHAVLEADASACCKEGANILDTLSPDTTDLVLTMVKQRVSFLLSDLSQPHCPIVYCSAVFCSLTGYPQAEVLNRSCAFLQGPGTDRTTVERIHRSIEHGFVVEEVILNYTKCGRPFWNLLSLMPLRAKGISCYKYYLGVQKDITGRVEGPSALLALQVETPGAGQTPSAHNPDRPQPRRDPNLAVPTIGANPDGATANLGAGRSPSAGSGREGDQRLVGCTPGGPPESPAQAAVGPAPLAEDGSAAPSMPHSRDVLAATLRDFTAWPLDSALAPLKRRDRVTSFVRGAVEEMALLLEDRGIAVRCQVDPSLEALKADLDPALLQRLLAVLIARTASATPAGPVAVSAQQVSFGDPETVHLQIDVLGSGSDHESAPLPSQLMQGAELGTASPGLAAHRAELRRLRAPTGAPTGYRLALALTLALPTPPSPSAGPRVHTPRAPPRPSPATRPRCAVVVPGPALRSGRSTRRQSADDDGLLAD
eukprot:EG_transcript_6621